MLMTVHAWRSGNNLPDSFFSFNCVGPRYHVGSKALYPLSHCTSPSAFSLMSSQLSYNWKFFHMALLRSEKIRRLGYPTIIRTASEAKHSLQSLTKPLSSSVLFHHNKTEIREIIKKTISRHSSIYPIISALRWLQSEVPYSLKKHKKLASHPSHSLPYHWLGCIF